MTETPYISFHERQDASSEWEQFRIMPFECAEDAEAAFKSIAESSVLPLKYDELHRILYGDKEGHQWGMRREWMPYNLAHSAASKKSDA